MKILLSLFSPSFSAEIFALFFSFIFLNRKTKWLSFRLFLLFIVLIEIIGWGMVEIVGYPNNAWVYNLLLLAFSPFLFIRLSEAPSLNVIKKYSLGTLIAFYLFYTGNALFVQPPDTFYSNILSAGSLLLLFLGLLFFYTAIKTDYYENILQNEYFWLAIGVVFFSVSSLLTNIFRDTLLELRKQTGFNFYRLVNDIFSNFLYPSLVIAFLCRKKQHHQSI
jgi:uncharacterized protein with PQ loop repeat